MPLGTGKPFLHIAAHRPLLARFDAPTLKGRTGARFDMAFLLDTLSEQQVCSQPTPADANRSHVGYAPIWRDQGAREPSAQPPEAVFAARLPASPTNRFTLLEPGRMTSRTRLRSGRKAPAQPGYERALLGQGLVGGNNHGAPSGQGAPGDTDTDSEPLMVW
jgi:hypothetical protein